MHARFNIISSPDDFLDPHNHFSSVIHLQLSLNTLQKLVKTTKGEVSKGTQLAMSRTCTRKIIGVLV